MLLCIKSCSARQRQLTSCSVYQSQASRPEATCGNHPKSDRFGRNISFETSFLCKILNDLARGNAAFVLRQTARGSAMFRTPPGPRLERHLPLRGEARAASRRTRLIRGAGNTVQDSERGLARGLCYAPKRSAERERVGGGGG
jgi:hypothetical protein